MTKQDINDLFSNLIVKQETEIIIFKSEKISLTGTIQGEVTNVNHNYE